MNMGVVTRPPTHSLSIAAFLLFPRFVALCSSMTDVRTQPSRNQPEWSHGHPQSAALLARLLSLALPTIGLAATLFGRQRRRRAAQRRDRAMRRRDRNRG